jgi:hypothetical protein
VEGIYIARTKKQLAKESILYRRLLVIFRTPALLLMLTARQDTQEERARGERPEVDDAAGGGGGGGGGGDDKKPSGRKRHQEPRPTSTAPSINADGRRAGLTRRSPQPPPILLVQAGEQKNSAQ